MEISPITINDVPNETLDLIFSFVPRVYRIFTRSVCKLWKSFLVYPIEKMEIVIKLIEFGDMHCINYIIQNGFKLISEVDQKKFYKLAARYGHLELLEWAFANKYKRNKHICSTAAAGGNLEILRWLRLKGFPWSSKTASHAALSGNFDMLKWLKKNKCSFDKNIIEFAAFGGNIKILEYLKNKNFEPLRYMDLVAFMNGQLNVLRWFKSNYPEYIYIMDTNIRLMEQHWNKFKNYGTLFTVYINDVPVPEKKYIKFLKWIKKKYYSEPENNCIDLCLRNVAIMLSVKYGYTNMTQWLIKNFQFDSNLNLNYNICDVILANAVRHKHFNIIKLAIENGAVFNENAGINAARAGQLEILQWILDNGHSSYDYLVKNNFLYGAIENGHFNIIYWAKKKGFKFTDPTFCVIAARKGRLRMLKWLRRNSCPWNEKTCSEAAANGHLEVLQWAVNHGCDWDTSIFKIASDNKHYDVLNWVRANSGL